MKHNWFKANLRKLLAGTLGVFLMFSSNSIVKADTSDQVTLSVLRPGAGYVNTENDALRVREAPSTSAKVLASFPKGTTIMIVERCGDFYKVQYDEYGHYGYAASRYIREYDLDYYCITRTNGSTVNMRSGTGTSYSRIASIPNNTGLPIMIDVPEWPNVLYGTLFGHVSAQYVEKRDYNH